MSILNSAWSLEYFIMDSLLWFYYFISLSILHVAVFIWRTWTKMLTELSMSLFIGRTKCSYKDWSYLLWGRKRHHPPMDTLHICLLYIHRSYKLIFLKPSHGLQSRLNYFLVLLRSVTDTGPFAWHPEHGSTLCFPSLPSAFTVSETRRATQNIIHV